MIREWIPEAVRVLSETVEIGRPAGEKLLVIKSVWTQLKRRAEELDGRRELSKRLASLPRSWRLDGWEIDTLGVSLPDQALAAFYAAVVIELAVPKTPLTMNDVAAETRDDRIAAGRCRAAVNDLGVNENDARSLANSADFFMRRADLIESINADSAYCLTRGDVRNDSAIRAKTRALARIIQSIFAQSMYGTVSTLEVSLLGGKKVSVSTIRNWCEGVSISD